MFIGALKLSVRSGAPWNPACTGSPGTVAVPPEVRMALATQPAGQPCSIVLWVSPWIPRGTSMSRTRTTTGSER